MVCLLEFFVKNSNHVTINQLGILWPRVIWLYWRESEPWAFQMNCSLSVVEWNGILAMPDRESCISPSSSWWSLQLALALCCSVEIRAGCNMFELVALGKLHLRFWHILWTIWIWYTPKCRVEQNTFGMMSYHFPCCCIAQPFSLNEPRVVVHDQEKCLLLSLK